MEDGRENCKVLMNELKHVTEDLTHVWDELRDLRDKLEAAKDSAVLVYVSKEQFAPVKNIVYGLVGIILTSVIGAILLLVLKSRQ